MDVVAIATLIQNICPILFGYNGLHCLPGPERAADAQGVFAALSNRTRVVEGPWASGHDGHIRRAAHGYEPTREAAMAAFARSWRRE